MSPSQAESTSGGRQQRSSALPFQHRSSKRPSVRIVPSARLTRDEVVFYFSDGEHTNDARHSPDRRDDDANGAARYRSTALDFAFAAATVNGWMQRRLDPGFDYSVPLCCAPAAADTESAAPRATSLGNAIKWASFTAPIAAISFLTALFVPRIGSLVGFLTR